MAAHRILVVNHTPNIPSVCAKVLAEEGFEVVTANDENEAVNEATAHPPAAILVEVESEVGLATIERLAKLPDVSQIIALAPNDHLALDAMTRGATDYLFRPVPGFELLAVISSAVAQYELARELAGLRSVLAHRYDREPQLDHRDRRRRRPSSLCLHR
jgi:DNA-binding response OmpR family regulator